ncbi:hypothetical protein PCCS19_52990 [Paenibacillus sp. CCS19]|uniref:hypothetical protein n=1 Tax=Paenibacillus sp. CCS19 TaxID=3158387 RepID=UPI00256194F2|nr:hypothetical protein [Paenibacillus cellulosilyticus]GMK42240.1 hypothetical protein PCCS19_52990 [Paenibacillus cellulosilyticus]
MIGKVNIALFFLIAVIVAFFAGVQLSDNVKSALNLGDSVVKIGEQKNPNAEGPSAPAADPIVESTENEAGVEEAGLNAGEKEVSEDKMPEESDFPSDNDTGNILDNDTARASERFSEPTDFNFGRNSVDGITLSWFANNLSGKKINYYTLNVSTYNAVGDPSYDQHSGESTFRIKYVGPVEAGEEIVVFNLFTYQSALSSIVIDSIDLEYADGTKETVAYDRSTSDDSGLNEG